MRTVPRNGRRRRPPPPPPNPGVEQRIHNMIPIIRPAPPRRRIEQMLDADIPPTKNTRAPKYRQKK